MIISAKKKHKFKRSEFGGRIIDALTQAVEGLERGRRLDEVFTVRMVRRIDPPGNYPPAKIKRLRASLGVSQAVFASILGVSVDLVQSWEIGHRAPSGMARRLLDEVDRGRDYWRGRLGVARGGGSL